jgi:hypothetical protein
VGVLVHGCVEAAEGGAGEAALCIRVVGLLSSFQRGECGRILSIAAPVIRKNLDVWKEDASFDEVFRKVIWTWRSSSECLSCTPRCWGGRDVRLIAGAWRVDDAA